MIGKVIKKHGGFYEVSTQNGIYECKLAGKQKFKQSTKIVAGDTVTFQTELNSTKKLGYIDSVKDRINYIPRPGIANIDQMLIIAAIKSPTYDFLLLDKMICLSILNKITPSLCFTKMDLAQSNDSEIVLNYYRNTGLRIFFVSEQEPLDKIKDYCKNRCTVFAGNSGVGKSSLINRIVGQSVQEVQSISQKLNRGKNTTRTAEFFSFQNGFIVDTPGFSALDLPKIVDKFRLPTLYPEYAKADSNCFYNDCIHQNEPNCEIKRLIEHGVLSKDRHENYLKLSLSLDNARR